jgi:hypothetical protein
MPSIARFGTTVRPAVTKLAGAGLLASAYLINERGGVRMGRSDRREREGREDSRSEFARVDAKSAGESKMRRLESASPCSCMLAYAIAGARACRCWGVPTEPDSGGVVEDTKAAEVNRCLWRGQALAQQRRRLQRAPPAGARSLARASASCPASAGWALTQPAYP